MTLGMEMVADAGYPVSEGTSTTITVWFCSLFCFILLFLIGFLPSKITFRFIYLFI